MSQSRIVLAPHFVALCSLLVISAAAQAQRSIPERERLLQRLAQHPPRYPFTIDLLAAGDFATLRQGTGSPAWRAGIPARDGRPVRGWMADVFAVLYGVAQTPWGERNIGPGFWGSPSRFPDVLEILMPSGHRSIPSIAIKHDLHTLAGYFIGEHATHSAAEETFSRRVVTNARDALLKGIAELDTPPEDLDKAWWRPIVGTWNGTFEGPNGPERMEFSLQLPTPGEEHVTGVVNLPDRADYTGSLRIRLEAGKGRDFRHRVFPHKRLYDVDFLGQVNDDMSELTGYFAPMGRTYDYDTSNLDVGFPDLKPLKYRFRLKRRE